jgi:uncharacterized membrane protein (DUF106 family)
MKWMRAIAAVLTAILREIFDEAAYQRFLDRRKLARSRETYAAFRREYEILTAPRPRCC